jgi:hypothetical protein
MSFAWSFLHVGQSMTANLFHSTSAVSGPKAARRLSERIVGWAMCSCIFLACGTFAYRWVGGKETAGYSARRHFSAEHHNKQLCFAMLWGMTIRKKGVKGHLLCQGGGVAHG